MFAATYRTKQWGLLLLRVLMGSVFIVHSTMKMDPAKWDMIGSNAANVGLNFAPAFWGFMAMFSELVGGALIILGFLYIPVSILTAITMIVAMTADAKGIKAGANFTMAFLTIKASLTMFVLSLVAILVGPGKYSLDALICKKMCKHKEDCSCHHGDCCTTEMCEKPKVEEKK